MFFELVKKYLPANYALVDAISELLGMGMDSAYRRIRGVTPLDFKDTITLCKHYGISLDSIIGITEANHIQCCYTPLDFNNENNLTAYMDALLITMKRLTPVSNSEIIMSASDIPIFSLGMFTDLVFFKFFSWSKNVYGISGTYDEFIRRLDKDKVLKYYNELATKYKQAPSTEIWSTHTIDTLLNLLRFHYMTGSFENNAFPIHLCEQLQELLDIIQLWTEKGMKYPEETPFKFYLNAIGLENSFVLFKQQKEMKCVVKLFTINNLIISDNKFCMEMESWLQNIAQQSTLISEGSAIERYNFFAAQRRKIRSLTCALYNNTLS
jgi:hypothetical protein